ncbi:MAG: hypothetical protein R2852_06770 [Bacteroidia bacterium]
MKTKVSLFLLLFISLSMQAQINMLDSTVQVITYWNKGETQTYKVTEDKFKIRDSDTSSKEQITYMVKVTVLDSTPSSYTIQWHYLDFKTSENDEFSKKFANMQKDLKVIFKINDVGTFMEVVNWREIKSFNHKVIAKFKTELKDVPNLNKVLNQVESTFASKEAIENAVIKDVQQFHIFHGGVYKLNDKITDQIKLPNILGGEPFDADISAELDEINEEDDDYVLTSSTIVNSKQLTAATIDYMKKMAEKLKVDPPDLSGIKDLKNEVITDSRIHSSGWVIESKQYTDVSSGEYNNVVIRTIELQ